MRAVVSCISYGLGNQLLQFAAGYGLSKRLRHPFDLDISWFDRSAGPTSTRSLLLTDIISNSSYRYLLDYSSWDLISDRTRRLLTLSIKRPYRHGVPIWNHSARSFQSFAELSTPVCIVGVPGYKDALSIDRIEILKIISAGLGRATGVEMPTKKYAFVHVRLGDFVSNPNVKAKMVQLSRNYYQEAMQRYEAKHGKTKWILLSDEPQNALDKLPRGFSVELGCGTSEIDDLYLMSRSCGGVIANSTFSLWGGLLAESNGCSVIAPAIWREDGRAPPELPKNWLSI